MKKIFLTTVVALATTLSASAQFMVITNYDDDKEDMLDKLTANIGIGFMVNDAFTVGLSQANTTTITEAVADDVTTVDVDETVAADTTSKDGYDVWVRYNLSMAEGAYVSFRMPSEDLTGDMKLGVGFSFKAWKGLYIEPSFEMPIGGDDDKDGALNVGLAYRF